MNFETDIIQAPSPNFNFRVGVAKCIVVHWTAGNFISAKNWFANKESKVSAHFIISKDGSKVIQCVEMANRAWHAGSAWHPYFGTDINSQSIGIELEGPPSSIGAKGWDPKQMETLWALCLWIKIKIPTIIGVTDHSTILPTMKTDVLGRAGIDEFPWAVPSGLIDLSVLSMRQEVRKHFNMKT